MFDNERKAYQPGVYQEYRNGVATNDAAPAQGQYDYAEDVFGNEEGAQVRVDV